MSNEQGGGKSTDGSNGGGAQGTKSSQGPSVINLSDYHNKEDSERKEFLLKQIEELKSSIENGNLTNLILEWEKKSENQDAPDGEVYEAFMIFWNEEESLDVAISKCARLQNRLVLMADGFIGS